MTIDKPLSPFFCESRSGAVYSLFCILFLLLSLVSSFGAVQKSFLAPKKKKKGEKKRMDSPNVNWLMEICAIRNISKASALLLSFNNDPNQAADAFFQMDDAAQAAYRVPELPPKSPGT